MFEYWIGTHIPKKLFTFSFGLQAQVVNAISQLDEWRIKERARFPPLLQEVSDTQSCLGICVGQAFVRSVHADRNTLGLTDLVAGRETSVEDLDDKYSKIVRVDGGHRAFFDAVPAAFGNLGRGIASRIRSEASVRLSVMVSI